MAYDFELGAGLPPKQKPGESSAEFKMRWAAWLSGRSLGSGTLDVGLPVVASSTRDASSAEQLGDWAVQSPPALPRPTRVAAPVQRGDALPAPALDREAELTSTQADPVHSEPAPRPPQTAIRFGAPGGAVQVALRSPADAATTDVATTRILAATGFDPTWGAPPEVEGLKWNPERFVYEPTADEKGRQFRVATSGRRDAAFAQAVLDMSSGAPVWRIRWVEGVGRSPDPSRPYTSIPPREAALLGDAISRALLDQQRGDALRAEIPDAKFDDASISRLARSTIARKLNPTKYAYFAVPTYQTYSGGAIEPTLHDTYYLLPRADLPAAERMQAWRDLCTLDLPAGLARPKQCADLLFSSRRERGASTADVGIPDPEGDLGRTFERRPLPAGAGPKDTFETREDRRAYIRDEDGSDVDRLRSGEADDLTTDAGDADDDDDGTLDDGVVALTPESAFTPQPGVAYRLDPLEGSGDTVARYVLYNYDSDGKIDSLYALRDASKGDFEVELLKQMRAAGYNANTVKYSELRRMMKTHALQVRDIDKYGFDSLPKIALLTSKTGEWLREILGNGLSDFLRDENVNNALLSLVQGVVPPPTAVGRLIAQFIGGAIVGKLISKLKKAKKLAKSGVESEMYALHSGSSAVDRMKKNLRNSLSEKRRPRDLARLESEVAEVEARLGIVGSYDELERVIANAKFHARGIDAAFGGIGNLLHRHHILPKAVIRDELVRALRKVAEKREKSISDVAQRVFGGEVDNLLKKFQSVIVDPVTHNASGGLTQVFASAVRAAGGEGGFDAIRSGVKAMYSSSALSGWDAKSIDAIRSIAMDQLDELEQLANLVLTLYEKG